MSPDNEYNEFFKDDIEQVWSKKLVREFDTQNRLHVWKHLNSDLLEPTFAFTSSTRFLGEWRKSTRTLAISSKLLRNFEWDAVVRILKHEMAHMIVSEIWKDISNNGRSHGQLFKKACKVMDVDPCRLTSTSQLYTYELPKKDQIVSKIHKLFCLGESNYEAEAEAAIAKAHELMTRYNISMTDLPADKRFFVFRPVGSIYTKVPEYVKDIARLVARYYFVKHIYMTHGYDRNGCYRTSHKRYIEFYGEPHNVDIAEYVLHFLILEGERQWRAFQKSDKYKNRFEDFYNYGGERKKGKYSKVAYLEGFCSGFERTLSATHEKVKKAIDPTNKLPVLVNDPLLDEKYKKHYNPSTWHCRSGGSNGGGWGEGLSAGESVRIRQGVTRGNGSGKLLTKSS